MQTKTVSIEEEPGVIAFAVSILRNSGVVAFPTETVYGLGCDFQDEKAIKRIFEIKGRPLSKPFAAHISSLEQVELFCEEIPDEFYLLAKKFLPGSLSVVLRKKKSVSDLLTAGLDTVAIRFPGNEMAIDLIESFGRPLAATSANISGGKSPSNAVQVYEELQDKIPLIIDGGETEEGKDSTVISLASKPAVLRHGVVPVSEIEEVLGCQFRL